MAWISLIAAGLGEVFGVAMVNKFHHERKWHAVVLIIVGFSFSFLLLSYSMKTISMGTAYAIWTGIGASGGAIIGMLQYGESRDWRRMLFISLIISSVIGLKLVS